MKKLDFKKYDCIIVGAGPSGVGTAVALQELGVKDYLILEKGKVGQTFLDWTKETKFISPSFTSNMFYIPDLNAVTSLSSPAFSFNKEHLSGDEYADYLNIITEHYGLKLQEDTNISEIRQVESGWELVDVNEKKYFTKHLVWAGGEWNSPKELFENTVHTNTIKSYKNLKNQEYSIIGSGESGVDMAFNLVTMGKKVTMFAQNDIDADNEGDDPSKKLSPISVARYEFIKTNKKFKLINNKVARVEKMKSGYQIILDTNKKVLSKNIPYEATGFNRVPKIIENYISTKNNDLEINNFDESVKAKNLFFVGPNLHRQSIVLCFIYKFRMRFAIVACEVAARLGINETKIEEVKKYYKKYNMYLEDVSSCDINCEC